MSDSNLNVDLSRLQVEGNVHMLVGDEERDLPYDPNSFPIYVGGEQINASLSIGEQNTYLHVTKATSFNTSAEIHTMPVDKMNTYQRQIALLYLVGQATESKDL